MDIGKELEKIGVARDAIIRFTRNMRGTSGMIPCPVCERNKIRFVVHENGKIHAHCNSDQCVSWME